MAHSVPLGMALLGFFRSPDMDAPAKIPDVAGNRMPKRSRNVARPLNEGSSVCGRKLSRRVCRLMPVNCIPRSSSWKGCLKMADTGILMMANERMIIRALLALAKMPLPARQSAVQARRAAVCRA